jgi:two-component system OmpR family response regulator
MVLNKTSPNKTSPKVLVVDDEPGLAELIASALKYAGFLPEVAVNGTSAIKKYATEKFDIIILDVMLPDMNGFDLAKKISNTVSRTPILFLTAKDSTEDKVRGLTVGGDDYVTKPFSLEELVARVNAILRRAGNVAGGSGRIQFCDLELDEETREVRRDGKLVDLTTTEFRLLHYLMSNAKKVMTRPQIMDYVWNYDFGGDSGILETYISYLRKKVDFKEPKLIHTVRGFGYVVKDIS